MPRNQVRRFIRQTDRGLTMIAQPSEEVIERRFELVRCAGDGLHHGSGMVGDGGWLMALEPRFHHATQVIAAALVAILIADVDFHPGDLTLEAGETILHDTLDLLGQFFASGDVVVGVYLDLHGK